MLLHLLQCLRDTLNVPEGRYLALLLTASLVPVIAVTTRIATLCSARRRLGHLRQESVSKSNMRDQFDPKYAIPEGATMEGNDARIKALYIHPVKSCGAVEVQRALLTKAGFLYDRSFALATELVDPGDKTSLQWRFLSQRTKPRMSQIKTQLWLPGEGSDPNDELVRAGGCLVLSFADPDPRGWIDGVAARLYMMDVSAVPQVSFIVPLQPPESSSKDLMAFRIHGRQARGCDVSDVPSVAAALPKLKRFLGIPEKRGLKLLRCTPETLVRTNKNLAPLENIGTPSVHGYTDQEPVNINSISSVQAVSSLLPPENQPLNALRFRANVWISGASAYEEESWKRFRVHPRAVSSAARVDVAPFLSVVCRTSRCTMPNVDIEKGTFDTDISLPDKKKGRPQPSTTLVEHRTVEDGNKSALGYLGMHCVPEDRSLDEAAKQQGGVYIEVGDGIEVLERGTHLYGSTANDY